MTTIKSTTGSGHELIVDRDNGQTVNIRFGTGTTHQQLGCTVAVADLAAALGLATREAHREQVAAVQKERDEARKDTRNAEMHSETYRVKYEVAEEARAMLDRKARELRAELDEAKATIARVEAALDHPAVRNGTEGADYHVRKALHPKPEFVLPTEVPATIEAKRIHFGWTSRLVLWTDGTERFWRAEYDGQDYTEAGVMDGMFTGHRLIGAES